MATEKKASLIVTLKDMASKGVGKLKSAMGGLKTAVKGASVALAGIGAFLVKSAVAWGNQQEAVNKLNTALKNVPGATAETSTRLQELAAELQKTTKFGDEATISMQGQLATFGLTAKQIEQLTPKVLDFATATGMDLNRSAMLVAKTITTQTKSSLETYGATIDDTRFKADPFQATLDSLTESFEGQAVAAGDTATGGLEKLKNAFGDLMETMGEVTEGPMKRIIDSLQKIIGHFQKNKESIQTFIKWVVFLGETGGNIFNYLTKVATTYMFALTQMFGAIWQGVQGDFKGAFESMKQASQISVDSMIEDFQRMVESQKESYAALQEEEELKKEQDLINKEQYLLQEQDFRNKKQDINKKADIKEKAAELAKQKKEDEESKKRNETIIKNQMAQRKRLSDIRKADDAMRVANLSSTLSTISSLQSSKNKELFIIGKAAALANATISIAQGISKAWAIGGPFGAPLAALVAAAGAAQLHTISATSMAEGGMVLPTTAGTLVRVAEAKQPEAIIPLGDDRAKEMLADTMGATNQTTININAGTIVADEESIKEFAEKIDTALFDLQQNRQTVSI